MTKRPTDDELRDMLRELPRPEPPPGFAAGVMHRIRTDERRARYRPWLLAAAAVAVFGVGLFAYRALNESADPDSVPQVAEVTPADTVERTASAVASDPASDPDRREFEALLEEYRSLAEEIETIQHFAGESSFGPLVRIGGSEDLDLFLDLQSYLDLPLGGNRSPSVIPISDRRR